MKTRYDHDFYATRNNDTKYAADRILDILGGYMEIHSTVDIGGGVGTWLKMVERKFNCLENDILLIEGDYVEKDLIQVKEMQYKSWNLEERIQINRRFDLAISLEVAEHLQEKRAETFCEDLTLLSDVVLFSAAIPGQGGVGHMNEQPLHYWVNLFAKYGYVAFDIIRPAIQFDMEIRYWYRQNTIVFVRKVSGRYKEFMSQYRLLPPLDMVSYDLYVRKILKLQSFIIYKIYQLIKRYFNRMKRKKESV